MTTQLLRAIAFYLPQFHPTPENDRWWGEGFTEWRNVAKCRAGFPGHYQPHLPADLGFYDLRLPETRQAQADLAKAFGVHGFCYYHYWFGGRRILERPFNEVLESGSPDFPFCLCWANENWTRAWDGEDREILLQQSYGEADDRAHLRWLARAFSDERYIQVDGKPLFLVYRASSLPDAKRTTDVWRDEAHKLGLGELFLCRVESFVSERSAPESLGFDASVEFAPDWNCLPSPVGRQRLDRLRAKVDKRKRFALQNRVYQYDDVVRRMLDKPTPNYRQFRCVTPMWDNTARRATDAVALIGSTPEKYGRWLHQVASDSTASQDPLVFINAWNEWAEGSHLEPCQRYGQAYLEATRRALADVAVEPPRVLIHD